MRSALLCVFLTLVVQRGNRADNDFKPMPIPLEWQYETRDARSGSHQETTSIEASPTVATIPAHYWEDALRHSVYLTLVRDKIDQLIAKGDVITPGSKPDLNASKDVDDHDLWEKIKTAPFDRKEDEEPTSLNDITTMAIGRLIEEKGGFRFTEDDRSKEKCSDEKCLKGVKALWSVKRIRQQETSPGRYHYELTFSVISQPPKKQRKPYETPVRTFTVRETVPERVIDMPQEHRSYERIPVLSTHRPERALWFHKNIVPTQRYQGRQYHHGLDRIFSSLFSSDDDDYDTPQRYRPNPYVPPVHSTQPQYSKVGYVGSPSDQQKRLTPYPYKPHSYKYARPPLPPPPYSHMQQHHYMETDMYSPVNNQFTSQPDHRYVTPNKLIKTTRPAVLPTPYTSAQPPKNWTVDGDKKSNTTDNTTKATEVITFYKNYSRPRPPPMKINYLTDHVRPPVYNAPPGVFVTMDKKPFKPMPPLKLIYSSKPLKSGKPIDFRPSPQVLDMKQFSEPDPLFDTAFRPITWNYSDVNTTEKIEVAESSTQINNTRKSITKGKKPPKKHENIKSERITSTTPEIITAGGDSAEENDALGWVNVVGAFTKTTPMVSQKEKVEEPSTSTPAPTTTTVSTTTVKRRKITTTEAVEEITTTPKPRKRTRPPPKFNKGTEKIKKHKRLTTTTTKAPEVKTTPDLTPQASSAAAIKPAWNSTTKSASTMSLTTTTSSTTTTAKPTTTTTKATTTSQAPNTSTEPKATAATTQPKTKSRFRESTVITKGTSVKHDKWSALSTTSATNVEKARPVLPLSNKNSRRNGSNFQGYISTTPNSIKEGGGSNHDHRSTLTTGSTTESTNFLASTSTHYEETADQYESNDESDDPYYPNNQDDDSNEDAEQENYEQESKDHTEYIFQSSYSTPNDKTNEIIEQYEPITTEETVTSSHSVPKNKTKCKKKKHNATTTEEVVKESDKSTTTTTTTTTVATPSIFEELFGGFTGDKNTEKSESKSTPKPELVEQQTENHSKFVKIDDDLQDFLDSLNKGEDNSEDAGEYDDDDERELSIDNDNSPFNSEDENASARDSPDNYDDYKERPYSLLELMAME